MKYRVCKKPLLFFLLLLTFNFFLFTTSAHTGYQTLPNNGLIYDSNPGNDHGKASHADNTPIQKDDEGKALDSSHKSDDKTGKISFGLEGGYGQAMGFVKYDAPIVGINFGYWVKKKIQVGLGFQYFMHYKWHSDTDLVSHSFVTFVPQIKYRILESPLTPIIGAGLGLGLAMNYDNDNHLYDISPGPILYLGGGVEYDISKNFSIDLNLKFIDIFLLMTGASLEYSF